MSKLADRIEALEKQLEALGPLARAREIKVLRGRALSGGVLHTFSWDDLDIEPAPGASIILDMAQGGEIQHRTVNKAGIQLRYLSGQNTIRRAWLVP